VLEQVAHEHGWRIVAKKVMPDRVHPSVRVGPANARASVVATFKGRTARVLRDEFPYMRRLAKAL
jgi:putative transposase